MNKTQKNIAGIVALIAFAGIVVAALIIGNRDDTPETTPDPVAICPIENGVVTYDGQENKTAFDILKSLCEVKSSSSDFGEFVTSIDGITADDSNYWAFFVNDEYANVGASSYKTKEGDVIRWQLETIVY